MEEHVLVVPRSRFDELGAFQGLSDRVSEVLPLLLDPAHNSFLARSLAENDPGFKQIIPYCVLRHEGRILRYFRGGSSGEKRLVAKASIGIGGHINEDDQLHGSVDFSTYQRAVERELAEEIHLSGTHSNRLVALLNDDSNDVGQVHLGVVHLIELSSAQVAPGEAALTDFSFLTLAELRAEADLLETWSRLLVDSTLLE